MTPEQLRKEASATEVLAALVSYAPDKERLRARADELRSWADALEAAPAAGGRIRGGALQAALLATPRRGRRSEG